MIFKKIIKKIVATKKPLLAVLIDPDKFNLNLILLANTSNVSFFLVGGSKLHKGDINKTILAIKKVSKLPVILFPGDEHQLSEFADGLFLPSLLSGRNVKYLIEKQIIMAPIIKKIKIQSLPMAYLLINSNGNSSTQKITKTIPLNPHNEMHILNTVIASELLGFKLLYLEAGSGSKKEIDAGLIKRVIKNTNLPVIVGGGIDSKTKIKKILQSGVKVIVVGNALEKNINLLLEIGGLF